ncbi:MAG: lytic transglycosylase F [Pseudomonadota bacterium]
MLKRAAYGTLGVVVLATAVLYGPWWSDRAKDPEPSRIAPAAGPSWDPAALRAEGIIPPSPPRPADAITEVEPVPADVSGAGTALLEAEPLQRWTGDFDGLRERKVIRVLVTYNRTNFFIENGRERGFEYELIQQLADFLNRDLGADEQPFTVVTLPMPFEQLIPSLDAGEGDIIAAGLTITPERQQRVDFTAPYLPEVNEILITASDVADISTLTDLAGRTVHVASGRTYGGHLRTLSAELVAAGHAPIEVVEVDPHLETEDLLQLVHAGMVELTVADDHIGQIWADSLPGIVLRDDLVIHPGGRIAWAIRPESPLLRAELDRFMTDHQRGTLLGNVLFDRYFENDSWISHPLAPEQQLDLARYADLFMRYGRQYDFDWRLIAALAFQESRLDQSLVSGAGALGLMQIKPSTAAEPAIGLPDVDHAETNVHAGVKYLDYLRRRYFDDDAIDPAAQIDFTLAAYNAGPRRVAQMRERAEEMGLDPNLWFRNVELAAFDAFSNETVDYVANINRFYVAYKLSGERLRSRGDAIDAMFSP